MATNPHIYVDENHGTNTGGSDTSFAAQQTGAMSSLTNTQVYDNLGSAVAGASPSDGDTIYFANNHDVAYDNGGPYALNDSAVINGAGLMLISVDTTAIDEYLPGASDVLNDTNDDITFKGKGSVYGVSIGCGDNNLLSQLTATAWEFVDMTIPVSGAGDRAASLVNDGNHYTFTNVDFDFAAAGDLFNITAGGGKILWNGGAILTTAPANFLVTPLGANGYSEVILNGVDISIYAGTLFATPTVSTQDRSFMKLTNCLLNSSVTPVGTLVSKNHRFEMYGCDDATDKKLYNFWIEDGVGSAKNNDTVYVTAGKTWYEGSDHSSIQVDTKTNCSYISPFVFELPAQSIDLASGTTDTLTIDMATAETLVKHDLAAFLVYPDGTTATLPVWVSSGPSIGTDYGIDPLDASTAMPPSALGSGDWTGSPGANRYELVLDTSGTPGQAAAVSVRIEVYKDLTNPVYIHPLITVSAT